MSSVYIRSRVLPSGALRYYVIAEANGRTYGRGGFGRRKLAEARKRQVEEELAAGMLEAPVSTFAEFAERWLRDYVRPNVRARTAHDYEVILRNHLLPAFGDRLLRDITTAAVQEYVGEKAAAGLSPKTVNKQLVLLKGMLTRAIEWGYIKESPARFVRRLAEPHREMDYYSPDEVARLLVAANPRERLLIATAVFTGLRQGELLALRWKDIDLHKGVVYVRRSYHPAFGFDKPKSAAGRRAVFMPPELQEMFRKEGFAKNAEALAFSTEEGRPLDPSNVVKCVFKPTMDRAGLRHIRFHDLRHTYATLMIAIGASPKLLQEQMGHESINTTYRNYGHLLPSAGQGPAEQMQALVREHAGGYDNVVPFPPRSQ